MNEEGTAISEFSEYEDMLLEHGITHSGLMDVLKGIPEVLSPSFQASDAFPRLNDGMAAAARYLSAWYDGDGPGAGRAGGMALRVILTDADHEVEVRYGIMPDMPMSWDIRACRYSGDIRFSPVVSFFDDLHTLLSDTYMDDCGEARMSRWPDYRIEDDRRVLISVFERWLRNAGDRYTGSGCADITKNLHYGVTDSIFDPGDQSRRLRRADDRETGGE